MTVDSERLQARRAVDASRAELVRYLGDLEEALNFPKRAARGVRRARVRFTRFAERQPAWAAAAVIGAVVVVGAGIASVIAGRRR